MRRAFMAREYRGMHDRGLSYPSRSAMIGELAVLPLLGPNGLTMGRGENCVCGRRVARALAGLAALVVGASCMPPDVPSRLSGPLPEALLARLEPDSVRVRFVREGLSRPINRVYGGIRSSLLGAMSVGFVENQDRADRRVERSAGPRR